MQKESTPNTEEYLFDFPSGMENHYWNVARNKIILDIVKKYNFNKILEVGCGRAIVTSYLYDHGIDIMGVEIGSTTAISDSKVPVLLGTEAISIPAELAREFNTISLFDVIEHIENPITFMQELSQHFPNVDKMLLTIPARSEIWTNFDDYYGHYRRYTLDQVKDTMEQCGFEVVENRYFFHLLYFMIWVSRFLKKREIVFDPPKKGLKLAIHKWLGNILFYERFILPKRFIGSSIICVAVKKK